MLNPRTIRWWLPAGNCRPVEPLPSGYPSQVSTPHDDLTAQDEALEAALRERLARVRVGATVCPSEIARSVSDDWRPLMEPTRAAARRLVANGEAEVVQRGQVVDPAQRPRSHPHSAHALHGRLRRRRAAYSRQRCTNN